METLQTLLAWFPYLLGGFLKNITIALSAMAIGTAFGATLAVLRFSKKRAVQVSVSATTSFFRNVPTLVILFYLATLLPNQWTPIEGITIPLTPALKASLALASSPLGFTAWNLYASIENWRKGDHHAAMLFIPNWIGAFLVTTLASSVSSLVGVDELVGRSNSVINATDPNYMIPVYLLAMGMFFVFCFSVSSLLAQLRRMILRSRI